MKWATTRFLIDLASPKVMGIVNVTPDSFSDGGEHASTASALQHCEMLIKEGADILDIGGESTRPGAQPLSLKDELARLIPVVRDAVKFGVPISIDTYKPGVMQAVLDLGADIINDIWALRWTQPDSCSGHSKTQLNASQVLAEHPACGVCIMHMHGEPLTMQLKPMTGDVVPQVLLFLARTALTLEERGVQKRRILIDPGIGFGKTVSQNFSLLARQTELLASGYPLLAGWSRKSSLAAIVGNTAPSMSGDAHEFMVPSVAAALMAIERGASIVRVHDVKQTVQAIQVFNAVKSQQQLTEFKGNGTT
jgi:dihydropteroate synthase